jgi:pimeloyl-ACP methyl ester carboxylesterase
LERRKPRRETAAKEQAMNEELIHRAVSADGTLIAGRVHGQGPPIVFISSALGDDSTSWAAVLPFLTEHYTCYTMSTRGRGLSTDHPDHSSERLLEDITAFVDSIDAPVRLVGHSSAGALALDVAARNDNVVAVATYEPTLFEFASQELVTSVGDAAERMVGLVEQGRMLDATMVFLQGVAPATEEELEALAAAGAFEFLATYLPVLLQEVARSGLPGVSKPAILAEINVPVLVLYGEYTHPFWVGVAGALQDRLEHATVREVPGVAHFAPLVAPGPLAGEFTRFFEESLRSIATHDGAADRCVPPAGPASTSSRVLS